MLSAVDDARHAAAADADAIILRFRRFDAFATLIFDARYAPHHTYVSQTLYELLSCHRQPHYFLLFCCPPLIFFAMFAH